MSNDIVEQQMAYSTTSSAVPEVNKRTYLDRLSTLSGSSSEVKLLEVITSETIMKYGLIRRRFLIHKQLNYKIKPVEWQFCDYLVVMIERVGFNC